MTALGFLLVVLSIAWFELFCHPHKRTIHDIIVNLLFWTGAPCLTLGLAIYLWDRLP